MIPKRAQELIRRNSDIEEFPASFSMFGREWTLTPGVFAPVYDLSTALFTRWLPVPKGSELLEVGCGAGITSVMAALRGCKRVTALDVTPAAVRNTRRNVHMHGVQDRVQIIESDLFSQLPANDRYDVIYWNSNFVDAPVNRDSLSAIEKAVIDPDYRSHDQFLAGAPNHLKPGGRIFLGFSTLGNRNLLQDMASVHGLAVCTHRSSRSATPVDITYQLLEVWKRGTQG